MTTGKPFPTMGPAGKRHGMVVRIKMTVISLASAAVSAMSWLPQPLGVGPHEAKVPRATTRLLPRDSTARSLGIIASSRLSSSASRHNIELL